MRAKQYMVRYLRGYILGIPPAISFFLCREGRLPKVSFFWASLMVREIIMSWPVNNCMAQWDICHYDAICPSPLTVLDQTERCLCFSSSPQHYLLFTEGRQTHKEADAEEEKWSCKNSAIWQYAHLEASFNLFFCSFIIKSVTGRPLGDACNVRLHGNCVNVRLKYTNKSWSLSGGMRQRELSDASKSVFGAKLTCHRQRDRGAKILLLYLSPSSLSSHPLSAFLTLSVAVFKEI